MNLLIVTGMSGAGKTQAANTLEDLGFYCVDNIPPAIIPAFINLSARGNNELEKIAIVTDIRTGDMFAEIGNVLDKLKKDNVNYKILFLDCDDKVLVRRFKENRRKHPLCEKDNYSVSDAVKAEREMLKRLRFQSDYLIDTTNLSIAQLKKQLTEIFLNDAKNGMHIQCRSFGFKYGIDEDADIVLDVRCLPNPFYIESLKNKTGLDKEVRDYVMGFEESQKLFEKIKDFIDYSLPLYSKEGKSQLVISFGCTGGKHRSVTFAELIYKHLIENGYVASSLHRDIYKGA